MATQSLIETYRRREAFLERRVELGDREVLPWLAATRDWLKANDPEYIWE